MPHLLEQALLNASQRRAIEAPSGPVLISAGAGTGKTRVLTLRYAYLVHHHGLNPMQVMAVTFTNKAAHEMKRRLKDFFSVQHLWVGTFHSLALRILRRHAGAVMRSSTFNVLDTSDQLSLVGKILKALEAKKHYTPRLLLHVISQWKQNILLPDEITHPPDPFFLKVYRQYQDQLQQLNSFDFDDLLMYSLKMFQDFPEILQQYHQQFQHVLVDEYQDVNQVQYLWLKKLVESSGCIFCVGDDDQSIYGWRGANVENMMRFASDFPGASIICLEDNYRSTPHILSAASALIAHNNMRYGKVLRTDQVTGEKIQVQGLWNSAEEAAFIAQHIQARHQRGEKYAEMAVLVRTGAQTREFEERFVIQGIPYHLVGNTKFYERQEVRDLLGYLRLIHTAQDALAFERIVNVPKRGLGPAALQNIHHIAQTHACTLEEASQIWADSLNEGAAKRSLTQWLSHLKTWRSLVDTLPLAHLAERILRESGYYEMLKLQGPTGESRIENLTELIKAMEQFASLSDFLEHVSLLLEVGTGAHSESVALMTLHAAKGLEFDTVFLPGWEENIFPHIRSVEEGGKKGIEEERRLAYVGLTRARKHSTITFCWNRWTHQGLMPSSPSRFIEELPKADITLSLRMERHVPPASWVGQRVSHPLFGSGIVQQEGGQTISVLFDQHGMKKVVSRFLTRHA